MKIQSKWAALIAEFVGVFLLTFAILAAMNAQGGALQLAQLNMMTGQVDQYPAYFLTTPFVAALTLGGIVAIFGVISGAHINPAITIALWTTRKIETVRALMYIVAQVLGAYLALVVAHYFMNSISMSGLTAGTDSANIFFAEALGTLVLSLGVAAVVYGKRSGHEAGMYVGGALFIGLVIAALSQGAGVLNPALMVGLKSVGWAFILGPIVGAVVGVNLYKMLVGDDEKIGIVQKAKKATKKA